MKPVLPTKINPKYITKYGRYEMKKKRIKKVMNYTFHHSANWKMKN